MSQLLKSISFRCKPDDSLSLCFFVTEFIRSSNKRGCFVRSQLLFYRNIRSSVPKTETVVPINSKGRLSFTFLLLLPFSKGAVSKISLTCQLWGGRKKGNRSRTSVPGPPTNLRTLYRRGRPSGTHVDFQTSLEKEFPSSILSLTY